jgi:TP901 family phage tail tape measure protein
VAVKVSSLSAEEAAALFVRTLQGWGAEADEVGRLLDILNEVSNNTGASFEELAAAFATVAPIASVVGLSFEELVGLLTPMIESLGSGEEAATALRTILARLGSDMGPVTEAFTELGVPLQDTAGNMTSVQTRIEALAAVWPTLTQEEKLYYANLLSGKSQLEGFVALMEGYDDALNVTTMAVNAAGSAQKELEVRMAASEEAVKRNQVAWELLAATIGFQLLDNFKGLTEAQTELAASMKQVVESGGLQPLFDILNPLMEKFAEGLQEIAKNLPEAFEGVDWSGLQAAVEELQRALGDLFGGIDLTTPEGLRQAIQFLIDVSANLINVTAGMVDGFRPWLAALGAAVVAFKDLSPEAAQAAGAFAGWTTGLDAALGVLDVFLGVLGGVIDVIKILIGLAVAKWALEVAGVIGTGAGGGLVGAFGALVAILGTLTGSVALGAWFADLLEKIPPVKSWLDQTQVSAEKWIATLRAGEVTNPLALEGIAERLQEISERTGVAVTSMEDFNEAVDSGRLVFDEATGQWVAASEAVGQLAGETDKTSDALVTIASQSRTTGQLLAAYGQDAAAAGDDTADLYRELAAISSNERIKNMEFVMSLSIAEVEANAKIATATLEGLATTIESTGSLIGTLFGLLAEGQDPALTSKILEQLEAEQEARAKALELQQQLTEQYLEYLRVRTEQIQSSDNLITIEAAGLQPHLEAFMWEILSAIQVRVNEDGLELLLGMGTG